MHVQLLQFAGTRSSTRWLEPYPQRGLPPDTAFATGPILRPEGSPEAQGWLGRFLVMLSLALHCLRSKSTSYLPAAAPGAGDAA